MRQRPYSYRARIDHHYGRENAVEPLGVRNWCFFISILLVFCSSIVAVVSLQRLVIVVMRMVLVGRIHVIGVAGVQETLLKAAALRPEASVAHLR